MGYHRAGFDVVGVDIEPQPNYPFEFIQGSALEELRYVIDNVANGWPTSPNWYDAIHASPPCQAYSKAMRHLSNPQPKLIAVIRELLQQTGLPWVIENVPGSPLARGVELGGRQGIEICGTQLGLRIGRHRLFETNWPIFGPDASCRCMSTLVMNPHNQRGRDRMYSEFGRGDPERIWREEMDVGWMKRYEAREAVPPAYTAFVGHQLFCLLHSSDDLHRSGEYAA